MIRTHAQASNLCPAQVGGHKFSSKLTTFGQHSITHLPSSPSFQRPPLLIKFKRNCQERYTGTKNSSTHKLLFMIFIKYSCIRCNLNCELLMKYHPYLRCCINNKKERMQSIKCSRLKTHLVLNYFIYYDHGCLNVR